MMQIVHFDVMCLGDDNYLASPKGALVDDHLLIVPIEHVTSIKDLTHDSIVELHKYQNAVFQYYLVRNFSDVQKAAFPFHSVRK
jgi:hypothetical protein